MHFHKTFISALILALSTLLIQAEPLPVTVSIPPLKAIVESIGGDQVDVQVLLQPGDNPVTFSPGPKAWQRLGQSRLFFTIGVPMESALGDRIHQSYPDIRLIDTTADIEHRHLEAHHHDSKEHMHHEEEHHEHESAEDPHVWLDPLNAVILSQNILQALVRELPEHAEELEARQQTFAHQVRKLHADLTAQLAPLQGKTIMVYHPAFGYFCDRYGLHQEPIEWEGKQPTARQLVELINHAHALDIHTLFVQPQFERRTAQKIATAIQGKVVAIDPLSADYPAMLETIANALVEAHSPKP